MQRGRLHGISHHNMTLKQGSRGPTVIYALASGESPVFDVHVFSPRLERFGHAIFGDRKCSSVEIRPRRDPQQIEQSWCDISMCRHNISRVIFSDGRSAYYEGDVYVLFIAARFAWLKPVLTNVESIVTTVEDVCRSHDSVLVQTSHYAIHHLINGLKRAETRTVEMIIVLDVAHILLRKLLDPIGSRRLSKLSDLT